MTATLPRRPDPWPEITEIERPAPWDYDSYPDELEFDSSVCADCGCGIGGGLHEDPETGHDVSHWTGAFKFNDVLYCEDCAIEHAGIARRPTCRHEVVKEVSWHATVDAWKSGVPAERHMLCDRCGFDFGLPDNDGVVVEDLYVSVGEVVQPAVDRYRYGYMLHASGPDHGVTWELESAADWPTKLEALVAGVIDAYERQPAEVEGSGSEVVS